MPRNARAFAHSAAMSLVANAFLSDRSLQIRSKAIHWEVRSLSSLPSNCPPGELTAATPPPAPHRHRRPPPVRPVDSTRTPNATQSYQRNGALSREEVEQVQRIAGNREKADSILDQVRPFPLLDKWGGNPATGELFRVLTLIHTRRAGRKVRRTRRCTSGCSGT